MFNVGFFQCQIVKALPHMNMPLFVNDIKAIGCDVECICADINKLKNLVTYVKRKKFDVIAVDYIFPIIFLNELKKIFPKTKLVIGGSGFLDAFLKSEIDFAVIGAGRESFLRLVEAIKNKSDIYKVPNLFLKINKNDRILVDYSGINVDSDIKRELFPYAPFLKWRYVGFKKGTKSADSVTIIAEFGCPHRSKRLNRYYDNLSMEKLSRGIFMERARHRIEDLFQERMRGGCSFCTYSSYISLSVEETIDCLMEQIYFLQKKYGFKSFSVGSENPFRFIMQLINQMLRENIKIEELAIRSRVDLVNKNRKALLAIMDLAKKNNFKLCLQQLGFESFMQRDLDIYNKGYGVTENFKAIKLMRRLKKVAPTHFRERWHGFLGVNPWITLQELKNYLKSAGYSLRLADLTHFSHTLSSTLMLYDRCLPIYQKLKKDGLLIERTKSLDTFRFKDKNVARFFDTINKIDSYLRKKYLLGEKSPHRYNKTFTQFLQHILKRIGDHAMIKKSLRTIREDV